MHMRVKCLVEELNSLQVVNFNAVEEDLSVELFIKLGNNVFRSGSIISDADFIFGISNDVDSNVDDNDSNSFGDNDETLPLSLFNIEAEEVLNKCYNLFFFSSYS